MKVTAKNPERKTVSRQRAGGFSLIELLSVVGIMTALMAVAVPAVRSISQAGNVNRAAAELSRTLEFARVHAMARQTYVRVGIGSVDGKDMVVMPIYPLDGSLDADAAVDMADPAKWAQLSKPLVLDFFRMDDTLDAVSPSTGDDQVPSTSDIAPFRRRVAGMESQGQNPEFSAFIQFNPNGEARVLKNSTARFIKIGVTGLHGGSGNPLIVRLSGTNGTIEILRNEHVH